MRYRDLKDERDAAVARAIEAERLSMKSEFDRVTQEFEQEKARLIAQVTEDVQGAYRRGFNDGLEAMASGVSDYMACRTNEEKGRS
jgi:carbamate kinase